MKEIKEDRKVKRTLVLAVAAVAIVVAVVLIVGGGDDDSSSQPPRALTEAELIERVDDLGQTVYWAGPQPDSEGYEMSTSEDGSVFLRYVSNGASGKDPQAEYVTVGTYPVPDAAGALLNAKESSPGAKLTEHDGYQVLEGGPKNVYVVFSAQPELQIELYSPEPGEAARLANAGLLTAFE
ncbi:MAG TPA: hypothetical protein VFL89_07965 [Solirubrobacterales bacterium]|nr:hypothetical protein [Solirubrobacterales bacterium]